MKDRIPTIQELADMIPSTPDGIPGEEDPKDTMPECVACGGSGRNSKGSECVPCKGTGVKVKKHQRPIYRGN